MKAQRNPRLDRFSSLLDFRRSGAKRSPTIGRRRLLHETLEDRRLLSIDAFPLPLGAEAPLGSLIYDSAAIADIAASGETDSFTIDLNDGQTVSVVVDPDAGLRPTVELLDPGNASLGSATAATGENAVLQTIPTTGAGTYTVSVGGQLGTTGGYTVWLILNAAAEAESNDGPTNDTLASAQDLDATFLPLGGPAEVGDRGAVLGDAESGGGLTAGVDTMPGYVSMSSSLGAHGVGVTGDVQAWANGQTNLGWAIFPTPGTTNGAEMYSFEYGSASLRPQLSLNIPGAPTTVTTGIDAFVRSGPSFVNSSYGTLPIVEWDGQDGGGENIGLIWFDVPQATLNAFRDTPGSSATLSYNVGNDGATGRLHRMTANWLSGPGGGNDVTYSSFAQDDDWYRFTLGDGQSATLAIAASSGNMMLELYDDGRNLLAAGVPAANAQQVVNNFTAPAAGAYYARARGEAEYALLVTRDADFDTERNDDLATAQQLAPAGTALGYLSDVPPGSRGGGGAKGAAVGPATSPAESPPTAVSDYDTAARIATAGDAKAGDARAHGTTAPYTTEPAADDSIAGAKFAPGRLIVRFTDSATDAQKAEVVAGYQATVAKQLRLINGAVVELPAPKGLDQNAAESYVLKAAAAWSAHPAVLYAEPDYVVEALETIPNDPMFSDLWGMHNTGQTGGTADADIDAPEAWDFFTGSSTVVIAGIDTGIDYNHEDLAANMWVNPGEVPGDGIDNDGNGYIDDIYGIDAYNNDSDPMDDADHGSHTAGTFGAVGNNGIGVAGVNWDVEIMALKFLGAGGGGSTSGAIASIDYITMMKTDYGVNVVASNNSWGGGGFSQALMDAIEASNDAGIMFVAAAGNFSQDNDVSPFYPATYDLDGIISVAATEENDLKAGFSHWGATTVDLGAPGVGTLSTFPNNRYGYMSGTSMASPHVAGAVGMLMAYSPQSTLAEVKAAILDASDPLASLEGITVSGGRLNVNNSLALMGDPGDYYAFEVNAGDELLIGALSWGIGTPGDGLLQFENLLDPAIELYDPSGTLVAADDNGAVLLGKGDGRNAQLAYTAAVGGTYTVRVLAAAEKGEYVLQLSGNTGGMPLFEVVATDPPDGQRLAAAPGRLSVDFGDTLLLSSLEASDLTVDGVQATGIFGIPDGNTVVFALPVLGEGTHDVAIAAGAILDLQNTPIEAYTGQFVVDLTGPRVIASSMTEDEIVPAGAGVFMITVQFDEELSAADLDEADVTLEGTLSGAHAADVFSYDPLLGTLTLQFPGLPEDDYTLTLDSGTGQFEDLVGNDLDGDPGFPLPSGDGSPGGDFVLHFSADIDQTEANPFWRLRPLGGMMLGTDVKAGLTNFAGDPDGFLVAVEAGQRLSAVVYPDEPTATLSIELARVDGPSVAGPMVAPGPGMPASLPPTVIPDDGTYVLRVVGDTHGVFQLEIGANLVTETVDTSEDSELSIDESFISLDPGAQGSTGRFGVVGRSEIEPLTLDSVVWGVQPASGQIVLIDPADGALLHSYDAPDALSPAHAQIGLSIAEGGESLLYLNSDVDAASLYRLEPATGAVLSIETTAGADYDGLAFEAADPTGGIIYSADMNTNPGWTLEGMLQDQWAFGVPTGQGGGWGGPPDPTSGFTGSNVIGFNLNGDYSDNMPLYYATTPAIDASLFEDVGLSFYRWLGVESSFFDQATVEVSNDGANWTLVWENSTNGVTDSSWTQQEYDISAVADGQPTVYIRWGMGPTDGSVFFCGWNLDDVLVTGTSTLPPKIFLAEDAVQVRRQEGFSGGEFTHLTAVRPSGALGGDAATRTFTYVPGTGIVEFDPLTPETILNTLPAPAADIEGLAFSGQNLFASTASGNLYTLDPDTGQVRQLVSVAGGALFGLGAVEPARSGIEIFLPDEDEYLVDLSGRAGHTIDVVLAGQDQVDFSSTRLELLDVDGTTVLATATTDPLGAPAENYGVGILDFVVPADGVYTLRISSNADGQYGLVVVDSLVFDSEPNNQAADPLRTLDDTPQALGFLSGSRSALAAEAPGSEAYVVDDGSSENGVGLSIGGDLMWINAFDVEPGLERITSIALTWGTPLFPGGAPAGADVMVLLYEDPNDDGNPNDAVLLTTADTVVTDPDTDLFTTVPITPTTVSGTFFVATLFPFQAAGQYPSSLDENSSAGRSWVAGNTVAGSFDINDLMNNDVQPELMDSIGLPGNWLLRADGGGGDGPPDTADLYQISLDAGDTLVVTTQTPLAPLVNDLDPALTLSAGGELMQNGSFETGDFTGWTAQSNGVAEVTPWTVAPGGDTEHSPVLITEAGNGDPDFVEIQNVAGHAVNTSGWFVVVNDASLSEINDFHQTLWRLDPSMLVDQVLYRNDAPLPNPNAWGENIAWSVRGPGWVMLVDDSGNLADFVVWDYSEAEIDSLSINVGGFDITVGQSWNSSAAAPNNSSRKSLQRRGNGDHNDASDWTFIEPDSMGDPNLGFETPFFASSPLGGTYSAYNGFNGDAGLEYELYQDVAIPAGGGTLTTNHRIQYTGSGTAVEFRVLEISIRDTDNNVLETLYTEFILPAAPPRDLRWNTQTFDLAAYADQTVRVHFYELIPEAYTGSAMIEFDDISITAKTVLASDADTEDGRNARLVFTATRTDTYTLEVFPEEGGGEYLLKTEIFDEPLPLLRIDDVEVIEKDSGATQAVLTVSLAQDPIDPVTVRLDTFDGTATAADNDYLPIGGQTPFEVRFDPGGDLTQQVTLVVNGDPDIEPREFFVVRLSDPASAIIADPRGVVTILNDDTQIAVVDGVHQLEGDAATTVYDFAISLVAPADVPVTVDYTTVDGSATVADLDYLPTGGTLTFAPQELERTISVIVLTDTQIEAHETFYLDFINPSQPIDLVRSKATIFNEDTEISIEDATHAEGDPLPEGNGTTSFEFRVSLAMPSAVPVTVRLDTADRTATVKDNDYAPIDALLLTFDPDETEKIVTVVVTGDTKAEGDETFRVNLNDASQPIARAQAIGTILDDDAVVTPWVVDRHVFYNNSFFDGNDPQAGPADDDAIAFDKKALLPGPTAQKATFANYTSYSRGINGLMVDVANLPQQPTSADFEFKVGNDGNLDGWTTVTATPTVTVRPGAGTGGSDRVTILFEDNVIEQQWLQVRVLASGAIGLPEDDVFYFGNAIGESVSLDGKARVNTADLIGARDNQRSFLNPAPIGFLYDFDRDNRVDVVDMLIIRAHITTFLNELDLITVPAKGLAGQDAAAVEAAAAHDAVLTDRTLPQRSSAGRETLSGSSPRLDWLVQFEQIMAAKRSGEQRRLARRAVDELLAAGQL